VRVDKKNKIAAIKRNLLLKRKSNKTALIAKELVLPLKFIPSFL
jgi:hypothetical protein